MKPNLSKLSKAQKLELLSLLEKKKQAQRLAKPPYEPHEGQLRVHKSQALQRFVFSGNGFGKSALLVNEVHWAATGYNPITEAHTKVPAKVYVILDKPEKVGDIFLPEYRKWYNVTDDQLHKNGKPYVSSITYKNGSVVTFLFHEQSELTAEGIELDWLFADEPMPRWLYVALRRGGRKKEGIARVLIAGTVLSAPWLWVDIYDPWVKGELENVECFMGSTEENKANLADGYIEEFSKSLTDKEKEVRLHGRRFDLDGSALGDVWDRQVHIVDDFEWRREHPVVIAIDPHQAKPHHAVMLGVNKENFLYVIKELKVRGAAQAFATAFKEWSEGYKVIDIVCDSLGNTPQTGGEDFRSFIEVLRKPANGIMVRSTTYADKNDEDWIDRIKSVLQIPSTPDNFGKCVPRLRVFRSCLGLIRDIETVQWQKIKNEDLYKPKLDISNKDFLSCLKYALASNLTIDKLDKKPYYPKKAVTSYGQKPTMWQRRFSQMKSWSSED